MRNKFTINVPFEKIKITDKDIEKRQELIKKYTDESGKINLYFVFKEYYEWCCKEMNKDQ